MTRKVTTVCKNGNVSFHSSVPQEFRICVCFGQTQGIGLNTEVNGWNVMACAIQEVRPGDLGMSSGLTVYELHLLSLLIKTSVCSFFLWLALQQLESELDFVSGLCCLNADCGIFTVGCYVWITKNWAWLSQSRLSLQGWQLGKTSFNMWMDQICYGVIDRQHTSFVCFFPQNTLSKYSRTEEAKGFLSFHIFIPIKLSSNLSNGKTRKVWNTETLAYWLTIPTGTDTV